MLILQTAEEKGDQRERKDQRKALAEKKVQLAELTPTKPSRPQSSIAVCVCLPLAAVACLSELLIAPWA